jgi:hypothetical protein
MERSLLVLLAVALMLAMPVLPAGAAPHRAPAATATPLPPEDPAITLIARKQFVAWQAASVNRDLYTDALNDMMTLDKMAGVSKALGLLGPLEQVVWAGPAIAKDVPAGSKTYVYHMLCADGQVYMEFSIEPTGKLAGLLFRNNPADF